MAKKARKRKPRKNLDEVAEALYWARGDSQKALRLLEPLTPKQRAEVNWKVGERIAADKARLGFNAKWVSEG